MYRLIISLFSLKSWKKRAILLSIDCFAVTSSMLITLLTVTADFDFLSDTSTYTANFVALFCFISVFILRRAYFAITRHLTTDIVTTIVVACVVYIVLLISLIILIPLSIPKSVPFLHAIFCLVLMAGGRFLIRALGQKVDQNKKSKVAIYGAGIAGRQLIEALKWNNQYCLSLLIDDNKELQGKSLSGIKIVGIKDAKKRLLDEGIGTVLLALPSASKQRRHEIADLLTDLNIEVKSIPDLTSLINGTAFIDELKDINILDILGRNIANPNDQLMRERIHNKTVLVTGAGGSIGSELCRQISTQKPAHLILMDISEFGTYELLEYLKTKKVSFRITPIIGSVKDKALISNIFTNFSIDTIYHAAAYKHVPLMEQNIMQCVDNNLFGTLTVAEAAVQHHCDCFVLVSTDKAVNPTNFMGASKRLAEMVCKTLAAKNKATDFAIVRFGNVLGSSGSVLPLFKQQIAVGGPVTVTHENVTRYFMTILEASQLVIQAGAMAKGGKIYILDMGKPIRIYDLAKKMITLAGKTPVTRKYPNTENNEILIEIVGLRPGEKMFEELSYKDNLTKTIHPLIMTAEDIEIKPNELEAFLVEADEAIKLNDYKKLINIITSIIGPQTSLKAHNDAFQRLTS